MVLFWPILAPKYEVPKLNTPKYVTLQKLTAKIELGNTYINKHLKKPAQVRFHSKKHTYFFLY